MSYAVIKTGGKQYRVQEGQTLLVERLVDDVGATLELQPLLVAGDGDPLFEGDGLAGAIVKAEVLAHERGPKLRIFKYKPKRGYRRRNGHRQELTRIKVTGISSSGAAKPKASRSRKKADGASKPATTAASKPDTTEEGS
jgi:large subunit ribosomal protein L21